MKIVHLKIKNLKILAVVFAFVFLIMIVFHQFHGTNKETVPDLPRDWLVFSKQNNTQNRINDGQLPLGGEAQYDRDEYNTINGQTCKERRNFVFIKTMKCATETVVRILRRFGYQRHLNFVLPRGNNIYLGWPYIMSPRHYRPSSKPYNILTEHAIYNKSVMQSLMPQDTAYITIIREPYSQFKSSFHYFNVANITGIKTRDHVTEYLLNVDRYETFYQSHEGSKIRFCIPDGFSVTKNLLSHCLGMPLGFPPSRTSIAESITSAQQYIEDLNKDFTLVMIMEYFHESLVLMRRLMCWSTRDILYRTENVGHYAYKSRMPKKDNLAIHQKWSKVDYMLYNHFNKTFWRKVHGQGTDFYEEVTLYNRIQSQVSEFCSHLDGRTLEIPASKFYRSFTVTPDFCLTLGVDLLTFIKERFDTEENWIEPEHEKKLPKTTC